MSSDIFYIFFNILHPSPRLSCFNFCVQLETWETCRQFTTFGSNVTYWCKATEIPALFWFFSKLLTFSLDLLYFFTSKSSRERPRVQFKLIHHRAEKEKAFINQRTNKKSEWNFGSDYVKYKQLYNLRRDLHLFFFAAIKGKATEECREGRLWIDVFCSSCRFLLSFLAQEIPMNFSNCISSRNARYWLGKFTKWGVSQFEIEVIHLRFKFFKIYVISEIF